MLISVGESRDGPTLTARLLHEAGEVHERAAQPVELGHDQRVGPSSGQVRQSGCDTGTFEALGAEPVVDDPGRLVPAPPGALGCDGGPLGSEAETRHCLLFGGATKVADAVAGPLDLAFASSLPHSYCTRYGRIMYTMWRPIAPSRPKESDELLAEVDGAGLVQADRHGHHSLPAAQTHEASSSVLIHRHVNPKARRSRGEFESRSSSLKTPHETGTDGTGGIEVTLLNQLEQPP